MKVNLFVDNNFITTVWNSKTADSVNFSLPTFFNEDEHMELRVEREVGEDALDIQGTLVIKRSVYA